MALWNYDPYSAFIMDTPRLSRDPWGLFEPEPLSTLLSPIGLSRRALRSRGIGSPAVIREVVSDKDKYQVKFYINLFGTHRAKFF